jgi:predicted nucleic acid-binding Zn ribbon protein
MWREVPEDYYTFWETHCCVCRAPIKQPHTGRKRRTCSDRCRQRLSRKKHRDYDREYRARKAREAERTLKKWERQFGPLNIPDKASDGYLDLRWRLKFRLERDIPIPMCEGCGRPFIAEGGVGPMPRFCSERCQKKVWRRESAVNEAVQAAVERDPAGVDWIVRYRLARGMALAVCAHCGKPFPHYYTQQKYCSKRCRQAAWRARRRCAGCGKPFLPSKYHLKRHRYCSALCQQRTYRKRQREALYGTQRVCEVCRRTFEPNKYTAGRQRYCSPRCNDRAQNRRRTERRRQKRASGEVS